MPEEKQKLNGNGRVSWSVVILIVTTIVGWAIAGYSFSIQNDIKRNTADIKETSSRSLTNQEEIKVIKNTLEIKLDNIEKSLEILINKK